MKRFSGVSEPGFDAVGAKPNVIEDPAPWLAIPGHGPVFVEVKGALALPGVTWTQQMHNPASQAWQARNSC